MEELVSVIIPVYNREKTIKRAIDSVIAQTYKNVEIIVVDDGSDDNTLSIVHSYKIDTIRVYKQHHKGANYARNYGIKEAKGTYIAFQDSDDEWLPEKLERQIAYMNYYGYSVCYCPYELHDDELFDENVMIIPRDFENKDKYEKNIVQTLRSTNSIGTPTLVYKRSILKDVGLFDEKMKRLQDYEYMIRIAQKYRIGYCDKVLVKAYRQTNSITNNCEYYKQAIFQIIKAHSDFIDIERMIMDLLDTISTFEKEVIDYELIMKLEELCGKDVFSILISYLHQKYKSVNHLLEYNQKKAYIQFEKEIEFKQFAIYGTGFYAQKVYRILKDKGLEPLFFLESNISTEMKIFNGIKVVSPKDIDKKLPIILAVNYNNQREITEYLDSMAISKYCAYPIGEILN